MQIEGNEVPLNKWISDSPDYHDFKSITLNLPEDTPTRGYRIVYKSSQGRYYSPLQINPNIIEQLPESRMVKDREQQVGVVQPSPIPRGYYYFVTKEDSLRYLNTMVQDIGNVISKGGAQVPPGELQLLPMEGIAADPKLAKDEGDRVKEMLMFDSPIASVKYSEIAQLYLK